MGEQTWRPARPGNTPGQLVPGEGEGEDLQPLDLDAIRTRAAAATPGPWHGEHSGSLGCVRMGDYGWVAPGRGPDYDVDSPQGMADAEFVAHSRQDVDDLLAALAKARRERDDLRARVFAEWSATVQRSLAAAITDAERRGWQRAAAAATNLLEGNREFAAASVLTERLLYGLDAAGQDGVTG